MTPSHPSSPSLSEIGHLFLTELRQKQGGARPVRTPPPSSSNINLTHEEFERACQVEDATIAADKPPSSVTALLSSHLADQEAHWIHSYARQAAHSDGRVGLIEIDAAELKVACFDRSPVFDARAVQDTAAETSLEPLDQRRMAQAMEELAWDVDRWLLYVHAPRSPQGRDLLRLVDHWLLLATADHDGVVAAYRTIKGLFGGDRPDLSLVVLDAPDAPHAAGVHQKLSGVCQKFLDCPVRAETPLRHVADVRQTVVLHCRGAVENDQIASSAHWKVISDFLSAMKRPSPRGADEPSATPANMSSVPAAVATESAAPASPSAAPSRIRDQAPVVDQPGLIAAGAEALADVPDGSPLNPDTPADARSAPQSPSFAAAPTPPRPTYPGMTGPRPVEPRGGGDCDVLDLPDGESPEMSILAAVLGSAGQFIRCPISPPDCPASIVAVSREKRLTLLAVAGRGLSDLRRIAAAFQWMRQNRNLIVMALPQFSIGDAEPALRLLVDQSDLSAGLLHPFLDGVGVTVQPYRKLRWGRKTGLLLEAA
jgi:hypothetical protein